jgi:hypothetical protein
MLGGDERAAHGTQAAEPRKAKAEVARGPAEIVTDGFKVFVVRRRRLSVPSASD